MEKEIVEVIRYFERFGYPPSEVEIYTFISSKISRVLLKKGLNILITKKKLIKSHSTGKFSRYTLENRKSFFQQQKQREKTSEKKLKKISLYLKLLKLIPQIKLVGLSGTLAMMNAEEEDDIDLFIIMAKKRLFTGRFMAIVISYVLGVRRSASAKATADKNDRVCLNLFFDEEDLTVPKFKQTEYVAHEVLQMKPMIVKGNIYEKFLKANKWVFKIFPNANSEFRVQNSELNSKLRIINSTLILNSRFLILNLIENKIEKILKKLQIRLINKHRTNELISDSQLWFHPEDFEKKILQM